MSNTFDKLSVLDAFIEEVNSYLPEIETNLGRLALSTDDMEALEETYRRAHTIGGSASMMDFPGLAHVAHGMEDILGDVLDNLATLDPPTLGLLHRSLQRIHRLVDGIHNGIDEDAIIAEDDADYTQYRSLMEASARGVQGINEAERNAALEQQEQVATTTSPLASSPTIPSLDEMLASFRTPSVSVGEEISWPEEPLPLSSADVRAQQDTQPRQPVPPTPVAPAAQQPPEPMLTAQPSALEILAVSSSRAPELPPVTPPFPVEDESTIVAPPVTIPAPAPVSATKQSAAHLAEPVMASAGQGALAPLQQDGSVAEIYHKMQQEAQGLEEQASSLKRTLTQLRLAASIVEAQRTEFKGFLDGSKDALDRMEEWAGKAMGLNLRNSPEQVRRYLPLSVMWVANSKLKKVLELLTQITSGVEMTDEQIHIVLQQLSASIESCGNAFQQLQAQSSSHIFTHDQGWTPWEMRVSREAEAMRERVTFERRGDLAALRTEIEAAVREEFRREQEAKIREEVRREYEIRPLTLAARSELERQLRNEIHQEFEAKRQLQERVSGIDNVETIQELENRLRSEIEIQVRQDFLNQITEGAGGLLNASMQQTLIPPVSTAPRTSNFIDQARQATGLPTVDTHQSAPDKQQPAFTPPPVVSAPVPPVSSQVASAPAAPAVPPRPQPAAQKPLTSASAFTADFGEEASEIFRLEAEEHLQTIIMHVAALEKSPTNREIIQGISRATHTLKGAAGMMGFRAIADLTHIFEDLLDSIMEGTTTISSAVLSLILDTSETLDLLITGRSTDPRDEEASVQLLRVRYEELLGQSALRDAGVEDVDVDEMNEEGLMDDGSTVAGVVAGSQSMETNVQRAARGDLSVRVRLQKLDELVNLL